jgi:hypothetical protein
MRRSGASSIFLLLVASAHLPAVVAQGDAVAGTSEVDSATSASITGAMRVTGFETFDINAAEGLKKVLGAWIDEQYGGEVRASVLQRIESEVAHTSRRCIDNSGYQSGADRLDGHSWKPNIKCADIHRSAI